jgi:PAS domain S-box-containing protein
MRLFVIILVVAIGMNVLMFNLSRNLLGQISSAYQQTLQMRMYLSANGEIQKSLALLSIGLATGRNFFIDKSKQSFSKTVATLEKNQANLSNIGEINSNLKNILTKMENIGATSNQKDLMEILERLESVSQKMTTLESKTWKKQLRSTEKMLSNYKNLNLLINLLSISLTIAMGLLSFFLYRKFLLEKKISKENEMKSSLFSSLSEAIFVTNSKGEIISCNQATIRMTGSDSRELIGKSLPKLMGHFEIESAKGIKDAGKNLTDIISKGIMKTGIRLHGILMGHDKWFTLNAQPVFYQQDSNNFSMILSFSDITEQVLSMKKIQEQQDKIIETSRSDLIAQMAGGIAHEINNPLTIISSSMELLDMKAKQQEKLDTTVVQKSTSKVIDTVNRIGKIVNGMLALSRKTKVNYENIEVGKPISMAVDLARNLLEKNNVKLILKEENFDQKIECYHIQISQVLINLMKNSVEAIRDLKERWIEIEVKKNENGIIIFVTDSGTGMSDELKDKIMLPFFTSKKIGEGTGLGLSISRTIIENHMGHLEVSKENKHTQFNIFLPYKISKAD